MNPKAVLKSLYKSESGIVEFGQIISGIEED